MNLALAIIAKNELDQLRRIIKDYGKYFDEIVIAYDDDVITQLEKSDKISLHKYKWCDDFSHKRNWLAEKIKSEFYFRLDTDDEIAHPEKIREVFKLVTDGNFDIAYVPYFYSHNEDGLCDAKHWRETIVKKRPDTYWKKPIHENIFLENPKDVIVCKTDKISIVHQLTDDHAIESSKRNFTYLLKEYQRDKENTDPRTIGYIGRVLMGNGKFREAIPFLELLIRKSGWDDDKYFAWVHLAECLHAEGNFKLAIAACNEALAINTKFPDAYLKMGTLYLFQEDYDKALDWLLSGLSRPEPDTVFVVDPSVYTYRSRIFVAMAYMGKGDYENAIKYFYQAKKFAPKSEFVLKHEPVFTEAYNNHQYLMKLAWMIRYAEKNDKSIIPHLVKSIPEPLLKDERVWGLKFKYEEGKRWSDKSIVIFCGQAWEDWAAPSVVKGIGGSEEAVIYLSQELAKLGWEVTVYNTCGDLAGEYNGVTYRNYYEFNRKDHFNIVVSWRNNMFVNDVAARKKVVWLHDVPPIDQLEKDYASTFHSIITLSQFHNSLLPKEIPTVSRYIGSNGINIEDFKNIKVPRNPKRVIWTSSYDRGLIHLLEMWDDVIKEVPDAELHIFYGWDTWIKMEEKGFRPKGVRLAMQKLMEKKGVTEHGRVGHKQLVKELFKSGIYAYPSHFEEISCISAMKAQASGCVCLTTDYAALDETNKYGVKVNGRAGKGDTNKRFKEKLISLLKSPEKQEKYRDKGLANQDEWGWDKVAKKWTDELFTFKKFTFKDLDEFKEVYAIHNVHDVIPIENGYAYERTKWAIDFVKKNKPKHGLDLGSYDGGLAIHLTRSIKDFKCDAMDIRDKEFDYARKVIKKENLPIEIFTGKAIEEFTPPRTYDVMFLFEVLEHTITPKRVLSHIAHFLEKDGHLLITVPDKDGAFGEAKDPFFNPSHLRDYTIETLKADIPESLEIIDVFIDAEVINLIARKK